MIKLTELWIQSVKKTGMHGIVAAPMAEARLLAVAKEKHCCGPPYQGG